MPLDSAVSSGTPSSQCEHVASCGNVWVVCARCRLGPWSSQWLSQTARAISRRPAAGAGAPPATGGLPGRSRHAGIPLAGSGNATAGSGGSAGAARRALAAAAHRRALRAPSNGGSSTGGSPARLAPARLAAAAAGSTSTGGTVGGAGASGAPAARDHGAARCGTQHQTIQGFGINTALMPNGKSFPVDKLFSTTGADAIGLSILRVGMNSDGSLTGPYRRRSEGQRCKDHRLVPGARPRSARATTTRSRVGTCSTNVLRLVVDDDRQLRQGPGAVRHVDRRTRPTLRRARPRDRRAPTTTIRRRTPPNRWWLGSRWLDRSSRLSGVKVIAPGSIRMDPRLEQRIGHGLARCRPSAQLGSAELWLLLEHARPRPVALKRASTAMATTTATGCGRTRTPGRPSTSSACTSTTRRIAVRVAGRRQRRQARQGGLADRNVRREVLAGTGAVDRHQQRCRGRRLDSLGAHRRRGLGLALVVVRKLLPRRQRRLGPDPGKAGPPAKRYYTLGNYSKFVRPGYIAVDVIGNSNPDVLLSAYKGPDGTVVVVADQQGRAAVTMPIAIAGGTAPAIDDART